MSTRTLYAFLGGVAEGTVQAISKRTSLTEYPVGIADARDHLEALSSSLAAFGKSVRRAIDQAMELHDADTADVFTEISRGIDKHLWLVEAHLQETRP